MGTREGGFLPTDSATQGPFNGSTMQSGIETCNVETNQYTPLIAINYGHHSYTLSSVHVLYLTTVTGYCALFT